MAREMKDSGVEWIGVMPVGWELHRMKSCISDRTNGAWGNDPQENDGDAICLRIADFDYSRFKFKDLPADKLVIRNYDKATIQRLLLQKGDILIEKSGGGEKTPVGRTVIFDKEYRALYANFMDRLRCSKFVTSDWMQYVFVTFYKNDYSRNYIKQTTGIQNLDLTSLLDSESVPVPSLEEQHRIVQFLNWKCSSIDSVIEQTRASIEEYKKLKQAVITQAVTKGIRPNREMKDSGIEWVGDMPADWYNIKITKILDYSHPYPIGDGDHGLIKTDDYVNQGVPYIRVQNLGWGTELNLDGLVYISDENNNKIKSSILKPNDILFAKTGATIGKTAIVPSSIPISNTTSHIGKLTVSPKFNPRYIFYVLSSYIGFRQFWEIASLKTTRPELAIDEIKSIRLVLPNSKTEQDEIVEYLNSQTAAIDLILTKKQLFITELESYKKSLIFEYVTGKKEVPA